VVKDDWSDEEFVETKVRRKHVENDDLEHPDDLIKRISLDRVN